MTTFRCKLSDFADNETHTICDAYCPAHAAVLYAQWSDRQAGEGYSERQVVCVWVDGAWQQFTVTTSEEIEYATEGFRSSRRVGRG